MMFSPIVGAFFRRPFSVEPHMHWLWVPLAINLPLSACERQSGWVLARGPSEKSVRSYLNISLAAEMWSRCSPLP